MIRSSVAEEAPFRDDLPSVLVVDDLEANLVLMKALLRSEPCNLVFARSGNDALRHLLRREFAVILLDVQMPEMDGFEVARHARKNPRTVETPIIFVTAMLDTEETLIQGYGSGAVDFLFKPVNVTVLVSKVRIFLDLFNGRRERERANRELHELAEANAKLAERFREQRDELDAAYRDLKSTQTQLVQSAKMAALGQLVAGVAHEINNPLAFIVSHMDTVRRKVEQLKHGLGGAPTAELTESYSVAIDRLREMGVGLERIRDLVLKLRTFSRLDEGEQKVVSVRASLDAILTIFRHRLADVTVGLEIGEPSEIECTPGLFNQAVANLISNALDAMDGRGALAIRAGADGDAYALSVSDSGPGIPVEARDRVLEPFFTTKPTGKGTGLGLSIAYGIVRKHGGTIDVGDSEHGGARVTIRIPLSPNSRRSK